MALPTMTYLFTSLDPRHEPFWSPSPVCLPSGTSREPLGRDFVTKIEWYVNPWIIEIELTFGLYRKTGYLHYVQLLAEDFETNT